MFSWVYVCWTVKHIYLFVWGFRLYIFNMMIFHFISISQFFHPFRCLWALGFYHLYLSLTNTASMWIFRWTFLCASYQHQTVSYTWCHYLALVDTFRFRKLKLLLTFLAIEEMVSLWSCLSYYFPSSPILCSRGGQMWYASYYLQFSLTRFDSLWYAFSPLWHPLCDLSVQGTCSTLY